MARMIGKHHHFIGPYGLKCRCCHTNPPPGKKRRSQRRSTKRGERQAWRQTALSE